MSSALASLDPGRSKCGLVRCDGDGKRILAAGVLSPEACRALLTTWWQQQLIEAVLLGDGTGSRSWRRWLEEQQVPVLLVPEAGTTLAARERYWQLEPVRGWQRLLPRGLRLPPRDVDDVVAQLLLERQLGHGLQRGDGCWLERSSP